MSKRMEIKNRLAILRAVSALGFFKAKTNQSAINELDLLAHAILNAAKKRAPVRTGALRASGRVEIPKSTTRLVAFGGGGTGVNYAGIVEFGGANSRPQPFLRPAFEMVKKMYKKNIIRETKINFSIAAKIGSS